MCIERVAYYLVIEHPSRSIRNHQKNDTASCFKKCRTPRRRWHVTGGCDWKWRATGRKHAFGLRRQDAAFPARHHRPSWPGKRVPLTLPPCSQSGDMSPQSMALPTGCPPLLIAPVTGGSLDCPPPVITLPPMLLTVPPLRRPVLIERAIRRSFRVPQSTTRHPR